MGSKKMSWVMLVIAAVLVVASISVYKIYTTMPTHAENYGEVVASKDVVKLYALQGDVYQDVGTLPKDVKVKIDTTVSKESDDYYKIMDYDYYVYYDDVISFNMHEEDAYKLAYDYERYVPFYEEVVSMDNVEIYQDNGELLFTQYSPITIHPIVKDNGFLYFTNGGKGYAIKDTQVAQTREVVDDNQVAQYIPVFMYHFFYDGVAGEIAKDGNWLDIHTFEEQIVTSKENGYMPILMKELEMHMEGKLQLPKGSYAITMDDNEASVKRLAYPVLERTQTYATSFVITSWVEDYAPLQSAYVDLQSHTDTMHAPGCSEQHGGLFLCIPFDEGVADMKTSSSKTGGAFTVAYPFGDFNDHTKEILREAGYTLAFTTRPGYVEKGMDMLELPRVRIRTTTDVNLFLKALEPAKE